MAIRVICINKDAGDHENPFVAITGMGWVDDQSGERGWSTRLQMYEFVEASGHAYVQGPISRARLIAEVSARGTKYVRTEANSTETDNLLKLPECR